MDVKNRFLSYVAFPTMSDEESDTCPSTKKQLSLAEAIVSQMKAMGIENARCDEHGYVYGSIAATADSLPAIGFIAHMDTSPDVTDEGIKAREILYTGGDIILNSEKNIVMTALDNPMLASYKGESLIVTDGTTLLGADDKAGIAEIMCAAERIIKEGKPHGRICIAFTPDEEIGRGADLFAVQGFGADFAYTVDGGALGELEYENFNAASAKVRINGVSVHPGTAKGQMKNAARIACELVSLLPNEEIPELTEGYEGFFHLTDISGECESGSLSYIIRDHDRQKFEEKKRIFKEAVEKLNKKYGVGTLECTINDSYYNMREIIENNMHTVERARAAMLKVGVTPVTKPIRGGTDGARLSFMGLPCPNLSTGGENFHSRFEFVSVNSMEKMVGVLVTLATDN